MQLLRHQASTGGCVSFKARVIYYKAVSRLKSARKAPVKLIKRPNHHLVEEPSPIKPGPTDYELYIMTKPMIAHLKQSQLVLAASWLQTTQSTEPLTTSPVKDNDCIDLTLPLPSSSVLANYVPSTKAIMFDKPASWSAQPATEELPPCPPATKPAAREPTAAAAAAALTDEEAAIMAAQLGSDAYPWLSTPAFVGFSVSLQAPGLFDTRNLKMTDRAGINSTNNVAHMEAGKSKMAQFLDRASNTTLDLPRLDVPLGSNVELLFNNKWESLLLHAVTPEDWDGDRAATWADMRMLAAYGVPMVLGDGAAAEQGAGVVSGAAAKVPAVAESVGSAAASEGVAVPRSGAAVVGAQEAVKGAEEAVAAAQQAVSAAKKLSLRWAGLKKLMGAVKLTLPLVVAAVTASGFGDLF